MCGGVGEGGVTNEERIQRKEEGDKWSEVKKEKNNKWDTKWEKKKKKEKSEGNENNGEILKDENI